MRKIHAATAGLINGILLYILVSLVNLEASFFILLAGWAFFTLLFYLKAETAGKIWARSCLSAAVLCLVIPLASWFLPLLYGPQAVLTAKQETLSAGRTAGSMLGGGLVNVLTSNTGILIGLVLLITAYFSLKPARRKR